MKKILKLSSLILAFSLAVCLFACSTNTPEETLSQSISSVSDQSSSTTTHRPVASASSNNNNSSNTSSKNSATTSSNTTSNSQSNNQQTNSSQGGNLPDASALTFAQRTDAYLDGATINDPAFISYYKSLGEYDFNADVSANSIFASPNGNGSGTLQNPASLQDAIYSVKAGQTIYLRGGEYSSTDQYGYWIDIAGTASNYITIRNYPGETPIITNKKSSNELYGFQLGENSRYLVIEGIEIAHITSYSSHGIAVWGNGQNHIILRNLKIHDIKTNSNDPDDGDAGANAILLFGQENKPISNFIIADCECYNNVTGWAETMSVASNCEYVYVLHNRVYDNTNIGIDFYGNAEYCFTPSLDQPRYCVASANYISNSNCSYADCAGLYVDGARDILLQYNTVTKSQYGIEIGSEERVDEYPVKNIIVRNNVFYDNKVVGMRVGGYKKNETGIVNSTSFINNTLINNGDEIVIAKVDGIQYINNIVIASSGKTLVRTDFNTDYCKNITFTNNYFSTKNTPESNFKFNMFESSQTGISKFNTLLKTTTILGTVTLNESFIPNQNSPVINNAVSANYGNYDYNLNPRLIGSKVDIGACELTN